VVGTGSEAEVGKLDYHNLERRCKEVVECTHRVLLTVHTAGLGDMTPVGVDTFEQGALNQDIAGRVRLLQENHRSRQRYHTVIAGLVRENVRLQEL